MATLRSIVDAQSGSLVPDISAGGAGSGCRGDNCGRPSTGDGRSESGGAKSSSVGGHAPRFSLTVRSDKDPDYPKEKARFGSLTQQYQKAHLLQGADKIVTPDRKITIEFDYPLTKPMRLSFTAPTEKGFTKSDFLKAVVTGYRQIYKNNLSRVSGHSFSDLVVNSATRRKNGVYSLRVSS